MEYYVPTTYHTILLPKWLYRYDLFVEMIYPILYLFLTLLEMLYLYNIPSIELKMNIV